MNRALDIWVDNLSYISSRKCRTITRKTWLIPIILNSRADFRDVSGQSEGGEEMKRLLLVLCIIMLILAGCETGTKVENYVFGQLRSINEDEDESGRLPHDKIGGEEVDKTKETPRK